MKKLFVLLILKNILIPYDIRTAPVKTISLISVFAGSAAIGIAHQYYNNASLLKKYKYPQNYQKYNNISSAIMTMIGAKPGTIRKKKIDLTQPATTNSKFQIHKLDINNDTELKKLTDLNTKLKANKETEISHSSSSDTIKTETLIAKSTDGNICGALSYIPAQDHVWISTLAVDPHYRRQGIAQQLIKEVEMLYPEKKYLQLMVEVYNAAAMLTYDKLGFD